MAVECRAVRQRGEDLERPPWALLLLASAWASALRWGGRMFVEAGGDLGMRMTRTSAGHRKRSSCGSSPAWRLVAAPEGDAGELFGHARPRGVAISSPKLLAHLGRARRSVSSTVSCRRAPGTASRVFVPHAPTQILATPDCVDDEVLAGPGAAGPRGARMRNTNARSTARSRSISRAARPRTWPPRSPPSSRPKQAALEIRADVRCPRGEPAARGGGWGVTTPVAPKNVK